MLVEDERVRLITFTGSGDVGGESRAALEGQPRARQRDAGGVCCDAPPDGGKLAANVSFAGQSCISVSASVLADAWDDFVRDFIPESKR